MKYRKKPIVVEAIQLTPHTRSQITEWLGDKIAEPVWDSEEDSASYLVIRTLEGEMMCYTGDFVIQGIAGEVYPCKREIFEATYEEVK